SSARTPPTCGPASSASCSPPPPPGCASSTPTPRPSRSSATTARWSGERLAALETLGVSALPGGGEQGVYGAGVAQDLRGSDGGLAALADRRGELLQLGAIRVGRVEGLCRRLSAAQDFQPPARLVRAEGCVEEDRSFRPHDLQ